jgi:hypothetical protein
MLRNILGIFCIACVEDGESGRAYVSSDYIFVAALPLPRIVAEKVKELYMNLERGTAIGSDLPRKPDEGKGRKRRRKRDEHDVEGDPREWGSMGKALADGMQFPKLLKPLDMREGQQMYHGRHDHEHAMEEGVVVSIPVTLEWLLSYLLRMCVEFGLEAVFPKAWGLGGCLLERARSARLFCSRACCRECGFWKRTAWICLSDVFM